MALKNVMFIVLLLFYGPSIWAADKHDVKLIFVHEFVAYWWVKQVTVRLIPLLFEEGKRRYLINMKGLHNIF